MDSVESWFLTAVKWMGLFALTQWNLLGDDQRAGLKLLLLVMALDLLTGVISSIANDIPISSARMRRGLIIKSVTLIVILVMHIAERAANVEVNAEIWLMRGFTFNEIASILENAYKLGLPIPIELLKIIKRFTADSFTNIGKAFGVCTDDQEKK